MMDPSVWTLVGAFVGFAVGCVIFLIYLKIFQERRKRDLRKEVNRVINQAKSQASRIEKSAHVKARDLERRMRNKVEQTARRDKKNIEDMKYQLENKRNRVELEFKRKEEDIKNKIRELEQKKEQAVLSQVQMEKMTKKSEDKLEELNRLMENVSGLSKEQAMQEIKASLESDMKAKLSKEIIHMEKQLKKESREKAQLILSKAVARFASEVSTERTTDSLPIKMEKTKGKIIGREGRNIRSLESACGVDIIIDESQEIILISCFDAVRREVAVKSINKLLEEGSVHPARIEEVVGKVKRDVFLSMSENGKKACFDLGIHDVRPTIVEVLGSLKYRIIEGQNVLRSCIEVAYLSGLIASEMGYDEKVAKRAGLFHAIGLGVDHRVEGSYSLVGSEYLRKNGESEEVCQAVRCHTGYPPAESILDHIIQSAHNLYRERPGAKRSVIENYVNRLKDVESIANSFDGVIRSFAVRAGKEIRVLVDSGKVTDEQAFMLSRDVAEKINKEMDEAGQLLVSVVRECRMVEQAR